ncbi:hypothetical protein KI387_018061, partial [Taxus chinensis]
MVKERLAQEDSQEKGWLRDGYPRSLSQVAALESLGIRPDLFILLDAGRKSSYEILEATSIGIKAINTMSMSIAVPSMSLLSSLVNLHSPRKHKHKRSKSMPSRLQECPILTSFQDHLAGEVQRLEQQVECSSSSCFGVDGLGQALQVVVNANSNLSQIDIDSEGMGWSSFTKTQKQAIPISDELDPKHSMTWFLTFGGRVPRRATEDVAFAIARFFQKGGTFQNYYMYHGGTNFGRTAGGPFISTSYDYDAPLDEYDHMELYKDVSVYEIQVSTQTSSMGMEKVSLESLLPVETSTKNTKPFVKWLWHKELIGIWGGEHFSGNGLLEQLYTTKDKSDFLWYTNSVHIDEDEPLSKNKTQVYLHVETRGHALHVFVNGKFAGTQTGSYNNTSFTMHLPITLKVGTNEIALLSMTVGWQTEFTAPKGDNAVALDLSTMSKGQAW